jgi:Fe-S-cluster containining protein
MYDINYYGTLKDPIPSDLTEPLPDLCHKCGRCCKSATTYHSHQKLTTMAEKGDKEAIDFLSIFQPYPSIEAAQQVVPEQVQQVLEIVKERDDMSVEELTFYHCRYVSKEGLCGIYERRPRCCREAPAHGWSVMPPGCGYEGWQFEQREKQKKMIRELKTSASLLEKLSPDGKQHPARPEVSLEVMKEAVNDKIKAWKPFGADFW